MSRNDQLSSWTDFLQVLETRFASSRYEGPTDTLFKLTHKGTVTEYLFEFESLANLIVEFLLSYFVSGLALEIQKEVQALQPLTMVQATTLTHLQEEKIDDSRQPLRRCSTILLPLGSPLPQASPSPLAPGLLSMPPKPPSIPFK